MKKLLIASLLLLGFATIGLTGCSQEQKKNSENGAIDRMTDEAARQAVDQVRVPLDKARAIRSQEEERLKGAADAGKE